MSDPKNGHPRGEKQTLVEEGTEFKGTLASRCPILIKGRVDGEVSGPSLHISPSGAVSGTVKVKELESEGELAGQCEAEVVRLSGRVKDRTVIRARTLEMKVKSDKGMEVTFGECELEVGDAPTKEEAVKPAEVTKPAAAEAKPVVEAKPVAEAKPAFEAKPVAEAKAAIEPKPAAEAKPAEASKPTSEVAAPEGASKIAPRPIRPTTAST
jgi:cytoskeletal protein CcmA (bactofilin family)